MDPNRKEAKRVAREAMEQTHRQYIAGSPPFSEFGKISRFNRDIVITEKIDGTNAAIGVTEDGRVYAQSRTRVISPHDDNYGFAAWVEQNREKLAEALGPGLHFGEWWGVGINRGYGLAERRFSLFNTARWGRGGKENGLETAWILGQLHNVDAVPVLYEGPWINEAAGNFMPPLVLNDLRERGSAAVPGYMNPEGIVIYHKASQALFKATVEGDKEYKGGNRDKDGNVIQ